MPASLIEELRGTIAELRREVEQLRRERDEYKRVAQMFQRELERLRDQQKTPREHVDQGQIELVFEPFAKQILENSSAPSHPPSASTDSTQEPKPAPKRTPHGRNVLPEHLPVQTLVLTPNGVLEGAVVYDALFRLPEGPNERGVTLMRDAIFIGLSRAIANALWSPSASSIGSSSSSASRPSSRRKSGSSCGKNVRRQ